MTVALVDSTKFPARLVGNGVSTVFPFQYKILAKGDIKVYVAGVLKTVDVDYTVAGFNLDTGGSVTFVTPPANAANVIIMRSMAQKRTTDYQQDGDFLSKTVNPDFDNAILLIQDLMDLIGRSIRTDYIDTTVNDALVIPAIATRASTILGFDSVGGLAVYPSSPIAPILGIDYNMLNGGSRSHSDGSNTLIGSQRFFIGNNAPSSDDSALLIGRGMTGSYVTGAHAVRDESTYSGPSGTGLFGYSSFDSIATIGGSVHWNHAHSYQARLQYLGSGTNDEIAGYTQQLTHNGIGTVTNLYGFRMSDALGTGPITFQAALYCDALTRGASNYCIYSGSTALPSYHGGKVQVGNSIQVDTPASAVTALKVTANGGNFCAQFIGSAGNPVLFSFQDGQAGNRQWGFNVGSPAIGFLYIKDFTANKTRMSCDTNGAWSIPQADAAAVALTAAGGIKLTPVTVASLPGAGAVGAGTRCFVSDATATTFASIVAGGGANNVPVYSDGTNWRIG